MVLVDIKNKRKHDLIFPKKKKISNTEFTIFLWYGYCKQQKKGFSGKTINFNLIY